MSGTRNQVVLPLDSETRIKSDDPVFKLAEICDTLDFTELYKAYVRTFTGSMHPAMLFSVRGLEPAVCSFAVPMVAALPLATADCGVLFYSLYHPQDALATSPITRSESPHS